PPDGGSDPLRARRGESERDRARHARPGRPQITHARKRLPRSSTTRRSPRDHRPLPRDHRQARRQPALNEPRRINMGRGVAGSVPSPIDAPKRDRALKPPNTTRPPGEHLISYGGSVVKG